MGQCPRTGQFCPYRIQRRQAASDSPTGAARAARRHGNGRVGAPGRFPLGLGQLVCENLGNRAESGDRTRGPRSCHGIAKTKGTIIMSEIWIGVTAVLAVALIALVK